MHTLALLWISSLFRRAAAATEQSSSSSFESTASPSSRRYESLSSPIEPSAEEAFATVAFAVNSPRVVHHVIVVLLLLRGGSDEPTTTATAAAAACVGIVFVVVRSLVGIVSSHDVLIEELSTRRSEVLEVGRGGRRRHQNRRDAPNRATGGGGE